MELRSPAPAREIAAPRRGSPFRGERLASTVRDVMRRTFRARVAAPVAAAAAVTSIAVGVSWYRRRQTRRGRAAFDRAPLESAVAPGATGARDVRLWGRSPHSGRHELTLVER